jgi:hypothetical protein
VDDDVGTHVVGFEDVRARAGGRPAERARDDGADGAIGLAGEQGGQALLGIVTSGAQKGVE